MAAPIFSTPILLLKLRSHPPGVLVPPPTAASTSVTPHHFLRSVSAKVTSLLAQPPAPYSSKGEEVWNVSSRKSLPSSQCCLSLSNPFLTFFTVHQPWWLRALHWSLHVIAAATRHVWQTLPILQLINRRCFGPLPRFISKVQCHLWARHWVLCTELCPPSQIHILKP